MWRRVRHTQGGKRGDLSEHHVHRHTRAGALSATIYGAAVGCKTQRAKSAAVNFAMPISVERLVDAPIVTPATHPSIGANMQGPFMRGLACGKVNQLRDPAILMEDDRVYLLYAVAAESGKAIAHLAFAE